MTLLVRACRFWAVQTLVLVRQTCPTCKTFQVSVRVRPTTSALLPRTQEGLLLEECFLLQHLPLRLGRKGVLIRASINSKHILSFMPIVSMWWGGMIILLTQRLGTLWYGSLQTLSTGRNGLLVAEVVCSLRSIFFIAR